MEDIVSVLDPSECDGTDAVGNWCPACDQPVEQWGNGPGGRPNARCLSCQSLERHRFLAGVLLGLRPLLRSSRGLIDFAPAPIIRRFLAPHLPRGRYVGVDLERKLRVEVQADATVLPFADDSFDLAISFHVFEHIPDDRAAMRELARVMIPGGLAIVQVPWRWNQPTDEEPGLPPDVRAERFGQSDHLRYYGKDFEDRLRAAGLIPTRMMATDYLDEDARRRYNVPEMPLWFLRSQRGGHPADAHLTPDATELQ